MEKKLLVISIDTFITEDLEIMKTLPNFSRVLEESSVVERNLTTYPSLTHSVHTTIQTGCRPGKHGVVNNEKFQPYAAVPQWFDDASDIRVPHLRAGVRRPGWRNHCPCVLAADPRRAGGLGDYAPRRGRPARPL